MPGGSFPYVLPPETNIRRFAYVEAGSIALLREPAFAGALIFCLLVRLLFGLKFHLVFHANANFWQMQDVVWLSERPWETIWLMHMQPPLLNALYAAALQLPTQLGPAFLESVFFAASLLIVAMIYVVLRRFAFGGRSAALLAALFGVLPQTLLYENIFGYQHLEGVLILGGALLAARFLARGRASAYAGFAACVAVLTLLRSQYHIGWVVVVLTAVALLAHRRYGWNRRAVAAGLAAVALVGGLHLKNALLFGGFSASSWLGMTAAQMATPFMAGDAQDWPGIVRDLEDRAAHGELSPALARTVAVHSVWYGWRDAAQSCAKAADKRAPLCAIKRSTGMENFNHAQILRDSPALGRDTPGLMLRYPGLYLYHLATSLITTFGTPSWDYRDLPRLLPEYSDLWNRLVGFRAGQSLDDIGGTGNWAATLIRLLAAASWPTAAFVILGACVAFARALRETRDYWRGTGTTSFWLFPALALLLFFAVPNLINGTETQRMRYTVEPLLYLAALDGARLALRASWARLQGLGWIASPSAQDVTADLQPQPMRIRSDKD
jgi:hypothetical protein